MSMLKNIQVARAALRQFNRKIGVLKTDPYGLGLSLSQGSALVEVERAGVVRPLALASLLNLEKSSVSRLLARLEEKGLLRVGDDSQDKRAKLVRITARGEGAVRKINAVADEAVADIFLHLNGEEQRKLAVAFELMTKSMDIAEAKRKGSP